MKAIMLLESLETNKYRDGTVWRCTGHQIQVIVVKGIIPLHFDIQ